MVLLVKSSATHGLVDSFRPVITSDQKHSHKIGITLVGVHICSRDKTTHLHRVYQLVILLINYMDIAESKQKKVCYFIWKIELAHGMAQ